MAKNKPVTVHELGQTRVIYLRKSDRTKWYQRVWDWGVKWTKRAIVAGVIAVLVLGVYKAGAYTGSSVEIKEVEKKAEVPAVLKRIAKCESPNGHFAKSGQVSLGANNNKSVDIGKYQINNAVWGTKATSMGYDLMVEKDNEAFATWIYQTRGTVDWKSSQHCWNK